MILFLDIDGPMASGQDRREHRFNNFTPSCVQELKRILTAVPDCETVISSLWRWGKMHRLKELFDVWGIPAWKGETPRTNARERGIEITDWLEDNDYRGPFAVLDDEIEDIVEYVKVGVFQTTFDAGLTSDIADSIIQWMQGHPDAPVNVSQVNSLTPENMSRFSFY